KGAPIDVGTVAAAGLAAITLYLMGVMCHRLFGLPAPVAMLFLAVLAKLTHAVSPHLQQGGFVVYKFFSTAVTYPLLFAIGVSMTPWDKLVAALNLPNLVTIVSTGAPLLAHVEFPTSEVLGPGATEDEIQGLIDRHKLVFVKPLFKGGVGKKGKSGLIGKANDLKTALAEKERLYFAEHRHGNVVAK